MSKVSIQGDANGTADFTIKAPNSNNDRTLNLPDEAGTVLTNVSDIETQVKTATNATGSAPVYACRAWVNFDGSNTTIRESGNVSSITDNGLGRFTVNFTNAMPDDNYVTVLGGHLRGRDSSNIGMLTISAVGSSPDDYDEIDKYDADGVQVAYRDSNNTPQDCVLVNASIFR